MALISVSIITLLGFLLWIQTTRIETVKEELARANIAKVTAELTAENLRADFNATAELNTKLQKESGTIRAELAAKNNKLQYYMGRVDELAKKDPALAETSTNNVLSELMQSVATATGGPSTSEPNTNSN